MDQTPEPHFKRGGTAHRVLTVLADGPLSMGRIKDKVAATDPESAARRRRKAWFTVRDLCLEGFTAQDRSLFQITSKGMAQLDLLGPLAVRTPNPNIRTFTKETA